MQKLGKPHKISKQCQMMKLKKNKFWVTSPKQKSTNLLFSLKEDRNLVALCMINKINKKLSTLSSVIFILSSKQQVFTYSRAD